MSTTDSANLLPLVDLITNAVKVVIDEYAAINQPVPSLDSNIPGPFDTPESTPPQLSKAIQIIEAACAQLSFTVASPGHVMTNKAYALEESACLQVITEAKVSDLLLDKPEGLHIDVLANRSNLDAGKLGRILRMLATKHCFNEVQPNVFANNRLSMKLVSTDPVSSLVGHVTGGCMKASSFLADALMDPISGSSMLPADAPFRYAHGLPLSFQERLNKAMIGWGVVTGRAMLPKVYPWQSLPSGTTICDVGGGNGHAMLNLLKAFPHLRVVVQDLKAAVEDGQELWSNEYPEALENKLVTFKAFDFFKDTPAEGCDFYYIRHVLHDWMKDECLTILRNIRTSAKPSSRLLIHEFVLQHAVRNRSNQSRVSEAPEPLLPNFGMGRVRLYQQDISMMSNHNSKERTLPEFVEMGEEAGFKFVKLWDGGEASLVEFTAA
ncbi:S-adenosyl-L-methionine-dependent methyltransferase [Stereum hirsutum FP-91666 SS1]|uniref:S-adenosyl-L-methionine-dependent methyltransferase n=1 Tax=Stereum hirsutum (strain FP-91666) TaxID=721885 RepID=UPI000440A9F4|nr:S-adenosyl-L-methionine-dependent methyltransferase [Stereum hirsutum FP-91666 SS1]EIM90605.1 S-adenosyl-L-methionine-dependent methyltransferase [Stereum hirsutum FP-91666 SS1]